MLPLLSSISLPSPLVCFSTFVLSTQPSLAVTAVAPGVGGRPLGVYFSVFAVLVDGLADGRGFRVSGSLYPQHGSLGLMQYLQRVQGDCKEAKCQSGV